jgi:hypothetical protein
VLAQAVCTGRQVHVNATQSVNHTHPPGALLSSTPQVRQTLVAACASGCVGGNARQVVVAVDLILLPTNPIGVVSAGRASLNPHTRSSPAAARHHQQPAPRRQCHAAAPHVLLLLLCSAWMCAAAAVACQHWSPACCCLA